MLAITGPARPLGMGDAALDVLRPDHPSDRGLVATDRHDH